MPYSINDKWKIEFEGINEICAKINEKQKNSYDDMISRREKNYGSKIAMVKEDLDKHFVVSSIEKFMTYEEIGKIIKDHNIRSVLGHGYLQPAKVAKYYGLKAKGKDIDGKTVRVVWGIQLRRTA
jgi:hypothetical protein